MSKKTIEANSEENCQSTLEACVKFLPLATAVSLLLVYVANVMVSFHIKAFLGHFFVSPQFMTVVEQSNMYSVLLSFAGLLMVMIYFVSSVIGFSKQPSFFHYLVYTGCLFVIFTLYIFFVLFDLEGSVELFELAIAEAGRNKVLCVVVGPLFALSTFPYAAIYVSTKFPKSRVQHNNKKNCTQNGILKLPVECVVAVCCVFFVVWFVIIMYGFYDSTGKHAAENLLRFNVWSAEGKKYAIICMSSKYAISEEIVFKDKQLWPLGSKAPDITKLSMSEDMVPEIYYGQQIITEIKDLQKITPVRFIHAPILKEKPNKKPNKDGKDNNLPLQIKNKPNMFNMLPTMPKSQKNRSAC